MTDPSSDRAEDRGHRPRGRHRAERNGVRQNATGPEAVGGTVAAENRPGDTGTTGGLGAGNTVASAASSAPTGGGADGSASTSPEANRRAWGALWAMVLGFFMILVDATIVSTAIPAITAGLDTDISGVLWVTSGYLLAYAVPLLITGRLGDRFGPKNLYLIGLAVFTLSSAACGFAPNVGVLIAARVVQGLGAAIMTPQTMAIITRIFPADGRGKAMGVWGSTAGVATLVGPILGGVLDDHAGWEWIFFVNVPVGLIGLAMAWKLVPSLPSHAHKFDLVGVALSAVALFCVVFGIQEGAQYDWGTITGIISVPLLIILGLVFFVLFILWERRYRGEQLVPLHLFANRNFSLANIAITSVGFAITAMSFPIMIYAQAVLGYSPTKAALLLAPMAVISGLLAPVVGGLVDRKHPAILAGFGLVCFSVALFWYGRMLGADTSIWWLLAIACLLGVANGFMWAPLSVTATRTLEPRFAGAGSGIYNTTRQIGAVIGSAAVASLMDSRLRHHLGEQAAGGAHQAGGGHMPTQVAEQFARAMGETLYLPAAVLIVGIIAAVMFTNPHRRTGRHAADAH